MLTTLILLLLTWPSHKPHSRAYYGRHITRIQVARCHRHRAAHASLIHF